ncbi:hypothetical protein ACIP97_11095 [Peribacillus frigoritolerans]|uniref:hypothetical protein n=1 Tax=Peribacillus frigoritolerans TaxID=450367 RepID=UPI00382A4297
MFLKRNHFRLIGAEVRDSCGSSGTGETPKAFTPRTLTARPAKRAPGGEINHTSLLGK